VSCKLQSIENWMCNHFHVSVLNQKSDIEMSGCNRKIGMVVCNERKSRYGILVYVCRKQPFTRVRCSIK
jgi:hypothetical protein